MKLLDRLIIGLLLATAAAVVLPSLIEPLATLVVVGTLCYLAVLAARYLTGR